MSEPRMVPPDEARRLATDLAGEWSDARADVRMMRNTIVDLAHTAVVLGEQRDAVLALHHKGFHDFITATNCNLEECDHEDGCPTERLAICSGCDQQLSDVDDYYLERAGAYEAVKWPCSTARALGVTA